MIAILPIDKTQFTKQTQLLQFQTTLKLLTLLVEYLLRNYIAHYNAISNSIVK